jgi:membrane associated rhomboid family serine protease
MTAPAPFGDFGPNGLPYCYRHPMRETGVRCIRCNRPICPDCMRPASVGFQCPDDVKAGRVITRTTVGAPVAARFIPFATGSLIAANVIVYVVTGLMSTRGLTDPRASDLFGKWVMVPALAAHGPGGGSELYRLITSAFLHLNLLHIASNMFALWIIGPPLERLLGWWRFLALYLLAALGGSVFIYVFDSPFIAVAGASGAIFGLFAAALLMSRRLGFDMRTLIAVVAANFVFTFAIDGVSKLGHIGGFVVGAIIAVGIGGLPKRSADAPRRVPLTAQIGAMAGVAAVLAIAIALRTAAL